MRTVLRRRVFPVVGALALLATAATPSARAVDAPADPLLIDRSDPSIPTMPSRLDDVEAAIDTLKRACAAWPPAKPLPDPDAYRPNASPVVAMGPPDPYSTRDVCTAISNPERLILQICLFSGALGAVLTVVGLVGFSWLGGVLVSLWAGRPAHRSRRSA